MIIQDKAYFLRKLNFDFLESEEAKKYIAKTLKAMSVGRKRDALKLFWVASDYMSDEERNNWACVAVESAVAHNDAQFMSDCIKALGV